MHIDQEDSEKELVARPSSNEDVSLENQRRADLLRSRIEELDRLLAKLKSDRTLLQRLLRKSEFSRSEAPFQ